MEKDCFVCPVCCKEFQAGSLLDIHMVSKLYTKTIVKTIV